MLSHCVVFFNVDLKNEVNKFCIQQLKMFEGLFWMFDECSCCDERGL